MRARLAAGSPFSQRPIVSCSAPAVCEREPSSRAGRRRARSAPIVAYGVAPADAKGAFMRKSGKVGGGAVGGVATILFPVGRYEEGTETEGG